MIIEDGTGVGPSAKVTSDFRLNVSARANARIYYRSRDNGDAYTIVSHDATAAAGTYIIYFKNDNATKDFIVEDVLVGGAETALWKLWFVTGTAAGGSVLTPVNLNKGSGNTASATARGDDAITSLATNGQISTVRSPANDSAKFELHDALVLNLGAAIAVEIDTDDGSPSIAEAKILGYYE